MDSNTGTFKNASSYTVPITIKATGYTDNGIAGQRVQGEHRRCDHLHGGGQWPGITVTAIFNVDHAVTVSAERTTVNIDGVNVAVVQCFANVSNMVTQPSSPGACSTSSPTAPGSTKRPACSTSAPTRSSTRTSWSGPPAPSMARRTRGSLALHLVSGTQGDTSIKAGL